MPEEEKRQGSGSFLGVDYSGLEVEYRAQRIIDQVMKDLKIKKFDADHGMLYDLYTLFYAPSLVLKQPDANADQDYYKMLETLMNSDTLKELRKRTVLNPTESEWAAAQLVVDILKEMKKQQQQQQQGQGQDQEGEEGDEQQNSQQQQQGGGKKKQQQQSNYKEDEMKGDMEEALKRLLDKMLKKKQDEEKKKEEQEKKKQQGQNNQMGAKTLQGGDSGHEGLARRNKRDAVMELARKINVSEVLRRVKSELDTQNDKGTRYVPHSPGETIDYEYGNDIDRVDPREFALPEKLLLLKWSENSLLLRKEGLKGDVGSLYILVDRSGSMEDKVGDHKKIVAAEAIATKLYLSAKKEGRDYYLRFFDTEAYELVRAPKSQAGANLLIDYMTSVDQGGGTDIGRGIQKALEDLKKLNNKHMKYIVLITDGEDDVERYARSIKAKMKDDNVKLITVMLGRYDNESLMELSDAYLRVKKAENGTYTLYKPKEMVKRDYSSYYGYSPVPMYVPPARMRSY